MRLREQGELVTGVVRSAESAERLEAEKIESLRADLDEPTPPLPTAHSRVFYLVPPPPRGEQDPRMERFLAGLARDGQPSRLVYVSTTGVYGDCRGDWVDETHPAAPQVDRARRRWDAEQRLRTWRERNNGELVILRVAGIYGPGKLPLERLRRGAPMVAEADAPWTNRIHVDDLVSVLLAAMERAPNGAVYNVSDGHPGNMTDYFNRVADLVGLPRPPAIGRAEAEEQLSTGMLSYLAESRRLSNRKMVDELGVELRYPTLDTGLPACLD
jgi:nucleoside-diphosphate-sugar epimerase